MKTAVIIFALAVISAGLVGYKLQNQSGQLNQTTAVIEESENVAVKSIISEETDSAPTERYSAQVDRVKVLFEQWNYTRYRLQTNELVREGEMNSERGFGDNIDATVYVLNWQAPEGEQIRYVRLTAEPGYLYALDSSQNIIKSGRLVLE